MADFTYMGSKKLLAPQIADLVGDMADGPFLDLFSGIAAVGSEIAPKRRIWCNDVQSFSTLLTGQRFRAERAFRTADRLIERAAPVFAANQAMLEAAFSDALAHEARAVIGADAEGARDLIKTMANAGEKACALRGQGIHCLLTVAHGATYFGVQQAIDLDSIRHAADELLAAGGADAEEHRWMVLALCQTVSTVSNSTGHFAQYLSPSEKNIRRVIRKRRMNCWAIWSSSLVDNRPIGTVAWRRGNRVFKSDAISLLGNLKHELRQPAVIYADPPYTSDQYSRYYHVLENAVLYDYPKTFGKGQYRLDRFTSGFSLKAGVETAFRNLIVAAAELPSVFVLSYPTNGLLKDATNRIVEILTNQFAHVERPMVIPHLHSTMGASKGAQKQAVDENIFVAYQNRAARWQGGLGGAVPEHAKDRPQTPVENIAA